MTTPDVNSGKVVFAAEIGGTTTRMMIACAEDTRVQPLLLHHYQSQIWQNFELLLADFLFHAQRAQRPAPVSAGIAAAGPVSGQHCKITNLDWSVDTRIVSDALNGIPTIMVNDFVAAAHGIIALNTTDFETLQKGEPIEHGVRAIAGAGTGWGQAILIWHDKRYAVIPTEGGHADFAPTKQAQLEFASDLLSSRDRVAVEDVLSGRGLVNIYRFLLRRHKVSPNQAIEHVLSTNSAAAAIYEQAENDPIANETMEWFATIYGSQLANLALNCLPRSGLYIAGGIAAKVLNKRTKTLLVRSFLDKEPMRALLERIPLRLVTNPHLGLHGAALTAGRAYTES